MRESYVERKELPIQKQPLEAALLAAHTAATTLGPALAAIRHSIGSEPRPGIESTATAAERGCSPHGTSGRPALSGVDTQFATCQLVLVELIDGLLGVLLLCEFHKSEPARAARDAIRRQIDVANLSDDTQQLGELISCSFEIQVSYENLCRNGGSPFV